MDFYPDEWLAGTATLDIVDVGIYITACSMIYSHGGPIQKAELKRFVRCHGKAFENALARLVASGKLTLEGSEIGSKRCVNELEKAGKRLVKWSENGSKGGRPSKEIKDLDKPSGSLARVIPTRIDIDVDPNGSTGADAPAVDRDYLKEAFDDGVSYLGPSSRGLIGKAVKQYGPIVVLDALAACKNEGAVDRIEFFVGCLKQRGPNGRRSAHADETAAFDAITRYRS